MVLAALLAVTVGHPAAVGAVGFAGLAVLERWGTPSLSAVAGAQSVLGAGGVVGPTTAATSAWLAAAALVLASPAVGRRGGDDPGEPASPEPRRSRRMAPAPAALVVALATGSAAAAAVAGPELGSDLALRLAATTAAVVAAVAVSSMRRRAVTAGLALAAGLGAAGLAAAVASGRIGL